MSVLPVIERELRAAARQPFSYTLRVLGVVILVAVLAMFSLEVGLPPGAGGRLFGYLHCALFFAIWALVPLLTADAISRERREGTLPLLLLTPLKPRDIVSAKGIAHGWRAFTLWLAVLPVVTIPLLAGGVGGTEVAISVLVNFSSICLALGAGLVASSVSRVWSRALASAVCATCCLGWVFVRALPIVVGAVGAIALRGTSGPGYEWPTSVGFGLALVTNHEGAWSDLARSLAGDAVVAFGAAALLCAVALALLVRVAAWNVQRTWQADPPSARVMRVKQWLVKPVMFEPMLRRWLRWELQHNPIGWLEQRSWSGRLVVWSWFAVVTCVYSSFFANLFLYQHGFHAVQVLLASLLAGGMAISAAGSFRREKETGVLELLLVAPLREWHVIASRVQGLWRQFLPAVVLLVAVWIYGGTFLPTEGEFDSIALYLVTFATLPVVGLFFSLAKPNFFAALFWTLAVQAVFPVMLARGVRAWLSTGWPSGARGMGDPRPEVWLVMAVQVPVALYLAWRLEKDLRYRRFVLESRGG